MTGAIGVSPLPPGPRLVPPPTVEQGHAQSSSWWMATEDELVPELQFPQSITVYQRMMTDSQVKSVMRAVALPVQQTVFRLDPNDARDEVVAHCSMNLGLPIKGATDAPLPMPRERDRFSWSQHLQWALLCIRFGFMAFEQVYRYDEKTGLLWLRKLGPRWPKTIERIDITEDGGLATVWQKPPVKAPGREGDGRRYTTSIPLDVSRLVMYVHEREGGSWVGNSLLRAAYRPWIIKDRMTRVWAMRDDRNSMGIPWYTGAEDEDDLGKGEAVAKRLRAGDSSGGAGPWGSKLELLGVTGTLPDVERNVRYQDEQIARSVLANFLNLGNQTGSWALGTTFVDFFTQSLSGLAQLVADTATQHVVEDLVDLNWGTDERAPRIVFDPIAQNANAVVQAVQMLIASGAIFPDPALDAFVRNLIGLPPKAPIPNAQTATGAAEPPPGTGQGSTT